MRDGGQGPTFGPWKRGEDVGSYRDYFAPEAVDPIYEEVARLLRFKRTAPKMAGHLETFRLTSSKGQAADSDEG